MTFASIPQPQRSPFLLKVLFTILFGFLAFLIGIGIVTSTIRIIHAGRIFPGITLAGVDLSNKTPDQAVSVLTGQVTFPENRQIVFRYENEVWVVHPQELGLVFDIGSSVQHAYAVGRQGLFSALSDQIYLLRGSVTLAPVIMFDERVAHGYLQNLAVQIDRPVWEPELSLNGTEVIYLPGQSGRILDVDKTLQNLMSQIRKFSDGEVPLVIEELSPEVLDATAQAEILRKALSESLILTISNPHEDDPGLISLEPSFVAGLLTIGLEQTEEGWDYTVNVDTRSIELLLEQAASDIDLEPQNATFSFNEINRQLVLINPSIEGRSLDIDATVESVRQGLLSGQHMIPLVLNLVTPEVDSSATAELLGISEEVSDGYYNTTYFRGSSVARLQNISTAAAEFNGLLVPPNSTFSMGEILDDISLENGYAEALIIYNGQTITGVGGGVCQVSTTLFRTAFFAGYPIVERHAHAYRVFYYEQNPVSGTDNYLAGLDATVFFPLVDLKFTNDRPYWLLMETYFDEGAKSLTWKFFSTDDGRTVNVQNLGLRNIAPAPEPRYEENPDLNNGTCKQVDYQGDGADITVTRVVSDINGQTLFTDNIQTHYDAWQAVYQYGPGTDLEVCGH